MQFVVFINAGRAISTLHSWRDLYSWNAILTLVLSACLTLVPVLANIIFPGVLKQDADEPAAAGFAVPIDDSTLLRPMPGLTGASPSSRNGERVTAAVGIGLSNA